MSTVGYGKQKFFLSRCSSIYINRSCPRKCPACEVVKPVMDRHRLSAVQWMEAFDILHSRGVDFFLILATEPLLLPEEELLALVRFWKERNYEYGLYTTSVQPFFNRLKDKLIAEGIRNWSSGMDYVPEVYDKLKAEGKLSETCISLVENSAGGQELRKKGIESLAGMRYMFDHSVLEQQLTITIYRSNIEFIPEMVVWIVENFGPTVRIALNYVEYGGDDFDFAANSDVADPFLIKESSKKVWVEFSNKMEDLQKKYWLRIQTPKEYIQDFETAVKQDAPGSPHYCAVSVENDGSMRKCGYRTGTGEITHWSVFDLRDDNKFEQFLKEWEFQVTHCRGCSWAYRPTIHKDIYKELLRSHRQSKGQDKLMLVNYRGEEWEKRRQEFEESSSS